MKCLLLSLLLFTATCSVAQDYSGKWTGETNELFNRPGYQAKVTPGKRVITTLSAGYHNARIEMYLEQSGDLITGTIRHVYTNEPGWLVHEFTGIIADKHAVLTEGKVVDHASVTHYYFATFDGEVTIDSAAGKMIMKGKVFDRYHKVYDIQTKAITMRFVSTHEFVVTKPIGAKPPGRTLPAEQPFTPIPERKNINPYATAMEDDWFLRERVVAQSFDITSDSLELNFYDDGDIDGDTISVYFNGNMLIGNKLLTARPLSIKIPVVTGVDNEIVMYAQNEGSIPPNTALLVFYDNGTRREIRIASDTRKSGTVIFRRK